MPEATQAVSDLEPLQSTTGANMWEKLFTDDIDGNWKDISDERSNHPNAEKTKLKAELDIFFHRLAAAELTAEDRVIMTDFLRENSTGGRESSKFMDITLLKRWMNLSIWQKINNREDCLAVVETLTKLNLKNGEKGHFITILEKISTEGDASGQNGPTDWKKMIYFADVIKKEISAGEIEDFMQKYWNPLKETLSAMDEENLLSFAVQLQKRKVCSSALFEWLEQNKNVIAKGGHAFTEVFINLVDAIQKGKRMNLNRILQMLENGGPLEDLEVLKKVIILVSKRVYPTPYILEKLKKQKDEKEVEAWIEELSDKMEVIRETEQIDPRDMLELEMYYAHLNIDIYFDTFKEVIGKLDSILTRRRSQNWEKIRISAQGAQAITKDIDEEKVEKWRAELLALAKPEAAVAFLKSIPALPKTVLDKESKKEFITGLADFILDEVKGKTSVGPDGPFNDTNVLGKTESILKLEPDAIKIAYLNYATFNLWKFIRDSEKFMKENTKMLVAEIKIIQKNITRAKELIRLVDQTAAKEVLEVIKKIDPTKVAPDEMSILTEYYIKLDIRKDRTSEEEKAIDALSMVIMSYGMHHLTDDKIVKRGMNLALSALSKSAVTSQDAGKKLFEGLKIACLLDSEATVSEMESGKAEVILENMHDLLMDRIDEKLEEILAAEEKRDDGSSNVPSTLMKHAYQFGKLEARNLIRRISNTLKGLQIYLEKNSQNEELKAEFKKRTASLEKKMKEIDGHYDSPPKFIKGNYHAQNTRYLVGSVGYATANNRIFDELIAMPGISEAEKKMLELTKNRLLGHKQLADQVVLFFEGLRRLEYDDIAKKIDSFKPAYARFIRKLEAELNEFPAYVKFKKELEVMENTHAESKKTLKKKRYEEHLAANGGEYNPAVFHAVLGPQIKEMDKAHGAKLRELRGTFEKENSETVVTVSLLEKLLHFARQLQQGLEPVSTLKSLALSDIELELSKITYGNLTEDEFELVPSKTLGDGLKGWVSDDCSTEKADHVHNSGFINYRVYRKEGNEQKWMGNIYILDARYKGEPVLIMDAIQVSRSASVNHHEFMQRAVEGLASMAQKLNYKHIIANRIMSAREGWMISNRIQLKQAYIDLYGKNEGFTVQGNELSMANSEGSGFQSFTYGEKNFVILWTHPDSELVVQYKDIESTLKQKLPAKLFKNFQATYKKSKFSVEMVFLTRHGKANLDRLLADQQKLELFISLFNKLSDEKSAHAVLMDEKRFDLIRQYAELGEHFAEMVVGRLISRNESNMQYFAELLKFKSRDAGSQFIMDILMHKVRNHPEDFETLFAKYKEFLVWGLQSEFMEGFFYKVSEITINKNNQILAYLNEKGQPLNQEERDLIIVGMHSGIFEKGMNIDTVFSIMKKYQQIVSSTALADHLSGTAFGIEDILRIIKSGFRDNLETVEALFDWYLEADRPMQLSRLREILNSALIKNPEDVKKLMGILSEVDELNDEGKNGKLKWLSSDEIIKMLNGKPEQLDTIILTMKKLKAVENPVIRDSKMLFSQQFLLKSEYRKAYLIAAAEDQLLDIYYFFIFHLPAEKLEEGDNIATLQKKFMQEKFDNTVLKRFSQLRNLIISGKDYAMVKEKYIEAMATVFDPVEMAKAERTQRGETEKIKKLKKGKKTKDGDLEELSDEEKASLGEQKFGYESATDWIDDKKSIYDIEFHN